MEANCEGIKEREETVSYYNSRFPGGVLLFKREKGKIMPNYRKALRRKSKSDDV